MGVDLHTHTTASDGADSPARLVTAAAAMGLSAVAVTDHDTDGGLRQALETADRVGIELVAGIELSLQWPNGAMHMLALLVRDPQWLSAQLEEVRGGRTLRNLQIAERLRAQGVRITIEEVMQESGPGIIGRPHFASLLAKRGYVSDISEAFVRYLGRDRPAYVDRYRLPPAQAVELAHRAGGVAVLAHPLTLGVEGGELAGVLEELAAAGLDGMEAYYGAYQPATRRTLAALARRMGLIPSGGSDYHGRFKQDIRLGVGRGDLEVPAEVLEELREAAARYSGCRVGDNP